MLDGAAVHVDQARYPDPDGAGQLLAGREPERLDHAGSGVHDSRGARMVGSRAWARIIPVGIGDRPRVLVAPMSRPTLSGGVLIGSTPSLSAARSLPPAPDASRRACRSWATGRRTGRASPTRPRPPRGRRPRRRGAPGHRRRWASRTWTTSGPVPEARRRRRARPRGRARSPQGTSPTAMLASVSTPTTTASRRSGSSPSTETARRAPAIIASATSTGVRRRPAVAGPSSR